MVFWIKGRHDNGFEFLTFDLRDDPQEKYTTYYFPNKIGKYIPNNPKAEIGIHYVVNDSIEVYVGMYFKSFKQYR